MIQSVDNSTAVFEIRDGRGETPLHSAVRRADLPAVVNLIAHGSNIDSTNPDKQTALHLSLSLVKEASFL